MTATLLALAAGLTPPAVVTGVNVGVTLTLGPPVVVAQAPPGVSGWGPYQVCDAEVLPGGVIRVGWHRGLDSPDDYGRLRRGQAVSRDGGRTWQETADPFAGLTVGGKAVASPVADQDSFGWPLPNGDRLAGRSGPTVPVPTEAGRPFARWRSSYGHLYDLHRDADLPPGCEQWRFARLPAGGDRWVPERATVAVPGELRYALGGRLQVASVDVSPGIGRRIEAAPDGSVWAATYGHRVEGGKAWNALGVMLLRSADSGRTWRLHGQIPFAPPAGTDATAKWDGFSEPAVLVNPDGSALCLLRTCDVTADGRPLCWSRSADGGRTWSRPAVFDHFGVWPTTLRLANGVAVACYGRPGVVVRATADPTGLRWGPAAVVQPPEQNGCGNAGLAAVGPDTAVVVYSAFDEPRAGHPGATAKTVLARFVTLRREAQP